MKPKKQQQQGGFLIFSDDKETFLKRGKHELTPSSKAAPEPRKILRRKTFDFQNHNDVNDSVKSQYNFNNSMCLVHQAVKKYIHSTISLFAHQCITIALHNDDNEFV